MLYDQTTFMFWFLLTYVHFYNYLFFLSSINCDFAVGSFSGPLKRSNKLSYYYLLLSKDSKKLPIATTLLCMLDTCRYVYDDAYFFKT